MPNRENDSRKDDLGFDIPRDLNFRERRAQAKDYFEKTPFHKKIINLAFMFPGIILFGMALLLYRCY